ncbi:MAG: glycosyltransferase [Pseudomonadota bacterium]|uniref:glycosyltransferase n=1 Tax=Sphingomonas sp. ERG5 TaxID=1381597 RepID=UPI00054C450F|nr:glycosyltransferase [Sphingomonas sp. ERG5]
MIVLMSSVGTRGDVQPVVALALEMQALGHEVRLCVPPNFVDWVAGLGFTATPVGIEMRAPRAGEAAPALIPDLITDQFETIGSAAQGCDLIVAGGVHQYAARSVAELHGLRYVVAAYAPVSLPSPDLAPPGQAVEPDGAAATLRLWDETRRAWNLRSLERVNANRARLGLARVDDVIDHILGDRPWLAADATLAPAPATPGMRVVQTGAWILPDSRPLAPALEAFLDGGEAPVYIGFGSMPAAPGTSRVLIDAVRAVGRRVIVSRGWADLAPIDDAPDCIAIGEVNQQALFTRVAAVVHHSGAGTTTAAARAGVAQIVAPMFSDQFYWGRRVRALGIGTAIAGLSRDTLASALRETLEPGVATRARAVATTVRSNGAAIAARRLAELGELG